MKRILFIVAILFFATSAESSAELRSVATLTTSCGKVVPISTNGKSAENVLKQAMVLDKLLCGE